MAAQSVFDDLGHALVGRGADIVELLFCLFNQMDIPHRKISSSLSKGVGFEMNMNHVVRRRNQIFSL
jgi:hypothetical protein